MPVSACVEMDQESSVRVDKYAIASTMREVAAGTVGRRRVRAICERSLSVLVGTTWTDEEIVVHFSPKFLALLDSTESLRLVMQHELCHVLTAPSANMTLPRFASPAVTATFVGYLDLFRERLAHEEFLRRFAGDVPRFHEWHARIFDPANSFGPLDPAGPDIRYHLFSQIFSVYYDAVFFELTGDDIFARWCQESNIMTLHRALGFAMEDMASIRQLSGNYAMQLELMQSSCRLFLHLDPFRLLAGEMILVRSIDELTNVDARLLAQWQGRSLACSHPG